jgi:uncharacterized membrane protein (UPF0182 family)
MARRVLALIILLAVLLLVVSGLPALIRLVADWYWFKAVQFESVFFTALWTKLGVGVVVGLIVFAFLALNLRLTQRGLIPDGVLASISTSLPRVDPTRLLRILVWPVALLFGLLFGAAASGAWLTLLQFRHGTPFGVADPVFGRDVSYYVFTLPAIAVVIGLLITVTVMALALTAGLYFVRRDLVIHGRRVMIERTAELHLAVLIALLFVGTAVSVWLVRIPSLLYSTTGPLLGASYSDLAVQVPVLRISALVALLGAAFVLVGTRNRHVVRNTAIAVLAYIGVGILGAIASSAIQRLMVLPNELVKEAPQLEHHIAATRSAWGIDEVTIRDLTGGCCRRSGSCRRSAPTTTSSRWTTTATG